MFYASSVVRAIRINFAFTIKDGNTLAVRIPCKSRRTFTLCPMIVYCTLSSWSTRIVYSTRVYTCSVLTSLCECTLIIRGTANFKWCNYKKKSIFITVSFIF